MIYTVTLNPAIDRELVVPDIVPNTVLRATQSRVDFGGKGFYVARMLSVLDTPSVALGFAGGDNGKMLHDGLRAIGIETDFIWVEEATRTNVSIVASDFTQYVKVNEPGPTISKAHLSALEQKIHGLAQPDDWWVLAGSLPPGVPLTIYADLISIVQAAGGHAILDTSGEALYHGCKAKPFLIKPNTAEARKLTDLDLDNSSQLPIAAEAIRAMGPAHVLISMGKKGAIMANGKKIWSAQSPEIIELNPIGAGDAMVGGLVCGLSRGQRLQEAFTLAIACGAATAAQPGTGVGTTGKINDLLSQIDLSEIGNSDAIPSR
jgi:1-phosphofructokinase family hexose kinase